MTQLEQSNVTLWTYTIEQMDGPTHGCTWKTTSASEIWTQLELIVISGEGPILSGCDIGENLKNVLMSCVQQKRIGFSPFEREISNFFLKNLEQSRDFKHHFKSKKARRCNPKVSQALSSALCHKRSVECELDKSVDAGILKTSELGSPIIVVCGDYKITINSVLDIDQYPCINCPRLRSRLQVLLGEGGICIQGLPTATYITGCMSNLKFVTVVNWLSS